MNFAARATAATLFSVALMDDICPPSTVFAAFNHYAGDTDITVWPYNGHEGGAGFNHAVQRRYPAALLAEPGPVRLPTDGGPGETTRPCHRPRVVTESCC